MFKQHEAVRLKRSIDNFHYQDDQKVSLGYLFHKLKKRGQKGRVKSIDHNADAIAVQFPGKRGTFYFKFYELERI